MLKTKDKSYKMMLILCSYRASIAGQAGGAGQAGVMPVRPVSSGSSGRTRSSLPGGNPSGRMDARVALASAGHLEVFRLARVNKKRELGFVNRSR